MNDLLHDRNRLSIVSLLASSPMDELPFTHICEKTGMTAGNLSSHLRSLEHGGLVETIKQFKGRRPLTTVTLTASGRQALDAAIEEMEEIIRNYRQQ